MTVFVDANVIVYASVPSRYRASCLEILEAVANGGVDGRTSAAVVEEVWHLELSGRAGDDITGLARRTYELFRPLLAVSDEIVARALSIDAPQLGANDRIHVATALTNGIGTIVSADAGFGQVPGMRRIDPLDSAAVERLFRSST